MMVLASVFLMGAVLAAVLSFIAGAAGGVTHALFYVFLVAYVISGLVAFARERMPQRAR